MEDPREPDIRGIHPEEVRPLWVLGDQVRFLGRVEDRDLHVVGVTVPPGSGTPPHRHASIEIFRVDEGEVTFGIFGDGPPRWVKGRPGTIVTVPSNHGHNYTNTGTGPAVMTVVVESSMCDFFREIGSEVAPAAGPPGPADMERVMEACRRHGIEILGGG